MEGGRLIIERGVLRHSTRVVPLDRIRGVDLQAPWLHRALGLVRVDVEAAAGGQSGAELSLAAVSVQEGERLRRVLLSARRVEAPVEEAAPPARVLYRATPRLLVAGGLTSGRHILAPLAIIGVIANFADDLPGQLGERLFDSAADRAPTNVARDRAARRPRVCCSPSRSRRRARSSRTGTSSSPTTASVSSPTGGC